MEMTKPKRFKQIKYRVGRYMLSRTELDYLRLQVARGEQPTGIVVTQGGVTAEITETGNLTENLPGMLEELKWQFEMIKHHKRKL